MARRLPCWDSGVPRNTLEALVILHCNFEELRALTSASELIAAEADDRPGGVIAHAHEVAAVERLAPRLTGDLSIETLDDQRGVQLAVSFICSDLHRRLDLRLVDATPADEEAVATYFDYGHARAVLYRLELMGAEMEAIAELISGGNAAASGGVTFPD
jgi:hypothetical protein